MKRRLILFRHTKSSWADNVEDHARPLDERGRKAAPVMGAWLARSDLKPDLALVSTARRAQQTWSLAADALGRSVKVENVPSIYEAEPAAILNAIRAVDRSVGTLIVVGHNPGFEELAKLLMKNDGGKAGARLREKFPTGAIAVLAIKSDEWAALGPGTATLEDFVTPRELG